MPQPQITVEIRWFFQGVSEKGVNNWFLLNPRLGETLTEQRGQIRSDLYLLASGNTGIGVKLREGRFEIKVLQHHEEVLAKGGAVSGRGEIWHKWKWPYAKAKSDKKTDELVITSFMANTPENLRVRVWKKRWQRLFSPAGAKALAPMPKSPKGLAWWIQAELTELEVKGAPWWTLALEIYGNPDEPTAILWQSLQRFLEDYAGPPLQIDNSYSYPQWLTML
jgi:hypothetical protein